MPGETKEAPCPLVSEPFLGSGLRPQLHLLPASSCPEAPTVPSLFLVLRYPLLSPQSPLPLFSLADPSPGRPLPIPIGSGRGPSSLSLAMPFPRVRGSRSHLIYGFIFLL